MQTGTKVSAAAHAGLIAWVILGGTFFRQVPPSELQVSEVSLLTEAEFAALVSDGPTASVAVPDPAAPEITDDTAGVPEPETAPEAAVVDAPEAPQPPEDSPDVTGVLEQPVTEAEDAPPDAPPEPEAEDLAVLAPAPEPSAPRPADRVAPVPTPEPDPDVTRAEEATDTTTPDPAAEAETEPETEAAPEAASTEIVTEAEAEDDATAAPARSPRPAARPERPAPREVAEPAETPPAENTAETAEDIAAAIAADIASEGGATEPAAPTGPPLTGAEKEGLRLAVQECWNVGSLSTDALRVTVTVSVQLNRDGTPRGDTIRKLSDTGGSAGATRQAYEAARRAIIRCGARGFKLPADKYERWRDIEMTFNPEKMRIR